MKCDRCGIEVYTNQRYGRLFDAAGGPHYCRMPAVVLPEYRECWCGREVTDASDQRYNRDGSAHEHRNTGAESKRV